jgi:hypothetical protein
MNDELDAILARWQNPAGKTEPQELQSATNAIEELYILSGRERPAVVWCQSFYQTLMVPSLIYAILHSDLWQAMSDQLLNYNLVQDAEAIVNSQTPHRSAGILGGIDESSNRLDAGEDSWWRTWNEVFPEIWINCGEPIFKGMSSTSRVHEYKYLKDSVVDQVRRELGRNLQLDRLKTVHGSLKREIYRRFWMSPLYEIGPELFSATAENTMSDIGVARLLEIGQSIPQFEETLQNATNFGMAVDQNFHALCLRFGAEPALQGSRTFWFAHYIPLLSTFENLGRTEYGGGLQPLGSVARLWLDVFRACNGILLLNGLAFLCAKPLSFHLDELLHLHSENGPALSYSDGFEQYAWHGAFVTRDIIEHPESITVSQIESEQNIEIRRVLLERFGEAKFLEESGMTPLHEDEFGILYKRDFVGDEPLTVVKVTNATPEPDGSIKNYYLRVPPDMQTAQQAVAWTFGFDDQQEYHPLVQT